MPTVSTGDRAKLSEMEILSLDTEAAVVAGRIEADLIASGRVVGRADSMIAAIALVHHLPLVTGNTRYDSRMVELGHPIQLDNWRAA